MVSKPDNQDAVQKVSPRQWIGLVVVYLSIPLVLLVCGGDFGWWQAWVYSLLIVATCIEGAFGRNGGIRGCWPNDKILRRSKVRRLGTKCLLR